MEPVLKACKFKLRKVASYKGIARAAFGKLGPYIVELANTGFLLGAMVGYIVIIGKVLAPFLDKLNASRVIHYDIVTGLITAFVLFPLSCLKTMHALRFTSLLSLACIGFLVLAVVIRGIQSFVHPIEGSGKVHLAHWEMSIFAAIPIISFAFTFHPNLIPIWTEQTNRTERKMTFSVATAISICCFAYIVTGLFGYLTFKDLTMDNILLNYAKDDKFMDVVKAGFLIIICFSYPVLTFPCREGLDQLFFKQPSPWWRRIIIALWLVGISFVLAITVTNIGVVFGFVGATVGQLVIYIFPSLFYIILGGNVRPKHLKAYAQICQEGSASTRHNNPKHDDTVTTADIEEGDSSTPTERENEVELDLGGLAAMYSQEELEQVESLDFEYPSERFTERIRRKYFTLGKIPAYFIIIFGVVFGVVGVAEILMKPGAGNPH